METGMFTSIVLY